MFEGKEKMCLMKIRLKYFKYNYIFKIKNTLKILEIFLFFMNVNIYFAFLNNK